MAASYKFGPFCLDAEGEVLLRGAEPIALGRRAVVLLRTLIERPGVVISKEALIEAAWSGLAVEESNLPVQIAALRRALEEVPGGEHRIDTLPRRGYRFVGNVTKETHGLVGLRWDAFDLKACARSTPALRQ
jgi:DNA-binding winged helix-turn-helix (wHTH) protein